MVRVRKRSRDSGMLAAEVRALDKAIPGFMADRGFKPHATDPARWERRIDERTVLTASYVGDGWENHPHLFCRFQRDDPRPDLPWDAPENHALYADLAAALGNVNPYNGKYNCLIFERRTADAVLFIWSEHLARAGVKYVGTGASR